MKTYITVGILVLLLWSSAPAQDTPQSGQPPAQSPKPQSAQPNDKKAPDAKPSDPKAADAKTADAPSTPPPVDPAQAQLIADTEKLLKLSQELKEEIAKSNRDTLSLAVIKKADEVEKLAKSLKERMNKAH